MPPITPRAYVVYTRARTCAGVYQLLGHRKVWKMCCFGRSPAGTRNAFLESFFPFLGMFYKSRKK